ncbi:hypothetical protein K491DRAFT_689058, partial [Lophiostoma macrostomum CBS 122681]
MKEYSACAASALLITASVISLAPTSSMGCTAQTAMIESRVPPVHPFLAPPVSHIKHRSSCG